ncbi:MAG: hypothetical protein GWN01_13495 [Nitrosopumilaceae archaeon]|nr:sensor histidine kinase [Nitrosopumilaceae archaeon]NIU01878.1 sensor histidine kinase [Nitrosopumilaceae archaeon]NIU88282.1 hypothetical protein [Nitrosopumilaceae archaeon]NIV66574.1 hypothetical protein [Nitrosopumilaceae archaeon]NIX62479.1 hypothetical protein [Nitrosopumilaceae archaeon]
MKGKFEISSTDQEQDIKIDILHALEDFLDAYNNHAEMVVTEAIANAIDVRASEIDIELLKDSKGKRTVSFHNNGPPMNRQQFHDYHVIAKSSKTKGSGIGFAGIGAKVYLAAWQDTIITTETTDGSETFGSDMYVKKNKLKYKFHPPTNRKYGTLYRVLLKPLDFAYLENRLEDIVVDTFSPAISQGLKIRLNKKKIHAWNPPKEFSSNITVKVKTRQFPTRLIVTKDDIPNNKCNIQYHVSGKVITTKRPSWIYDVKPLFQKRFHVYVDAMEVADQLNLNKTNFKTGSGTVVSPVMQEVERRIFTILERHGYVKDDKAPPKWETNRLTRFFEKLFKDPKYAFLNPESRGGIGAGTGRGSGGTGSGKGSSHTGTPKGGNNPGGTGGGGFSLGFADRENDKREGWLDPATNKLVVNIGHPLFIKYENDIQARNQRIGTILTGVLIKNVAARKSMTPVEAFDLQTELLTLAKDEMW